MAKTQYDLSLIVACYREAQHLEQSMQETIAVLDCCCWKYEIIFVDDCSPDNTREIINKIIDSYPRHELKKIFHAKNSGRGGAVTDGIKMAQGRVVGFIDIDLEVHARYIPAMVLAIENGYDLAIAYRIYKLKIGLLFRNFLSRGYIWIMNRMLGVKLIDTEAGYKFFKRERILPVLDEIEDQGWFWDTEIMVRTYLKDFRQAVIPCLFIRRYDKQSTVNVVRDTLDYFLRLWRFRKVVNKIRQKGN